MDIARKLLVLIPLCALGWSGVIFAQAPRINTINPTHGYVGASVTIEGGGFGAIPANNIVYFGGVKATVNSGDTSSLQVSVPPGATYMPISVTFGRRTAYSSTPFLPTFVGPGVIDTTSFAAHFEFDSGTAPEFLATGDFDGDGKPDFATASFGSTALSVFRNTSTPGSITGSSFAEKVDFTTTTGPTGIAAADIDGDGKLDLVGANYTGGTISVFQNTGTSGTIAFASRGDFDVLSGPFGIAISDLNGDGKPDVVTANEGGDSVTVLRNTSTIASISFATKVNFRAGIGPVNVAIGDIDGDGKPDIVVVNQTDSTISVLMNTSTGGPLSFAPKVDQNVGTAPNGVAICDLDGDGKPDLAVTNRISNTVSVVRNISTSGLIEFASWVEFPTGTNPRCIAAGDLDGDGKPDLAVANYASSTASVFKNISTSGLISLAPKVDFATGLNPKGFAIGDMDGDGRADLLAGNNTDNSVSVLRKTVDQDTIPPSIVHAPVLTSVVGQPIVITTRISDNDVVAGATVYFRKGGDPTFGNMSMSSSASDTFKATIPTGTVTLAGLEYYIRASDTSGNFRRNPVAGVHGVKVTIGGEGLVRNSAQPSGVGQTAYRLISVPLDVTNDLASAILVDDLGAYDTTKWRFYELLPDQTYRQFSVTSHMRPGKGFWLIVAEAGRTIDTGPARSLDTDREFRIPLDTGWTFVGNPFSFAIPFNRLTRTSGEPVDLRSFNESFGFHTSQIFPFEGFAASNNTGTKDTLIVDVVAQPPSRPAENPQTNLWSLNITAECQQSKDVDNLACVASGASFDLDESDKPEPPVIGEYVSVYFPHPQWGRTFKNYCVDTRPENSEGQLWDCEVRSNIRNRVVLNFEGIDGIPQDLEVWLVDKVLRTTRNLRESNVYFFGNGDEIHPRQLMLIVGTSGFVQKKLDEVDVMPATFELSQNFPNPFNPTTTIRYGLPVASHVRLRIYNMLGQEIATLVDQYEVKGFKAVEVNGSDFGSGVYFYRLEAGAYSETRKMILLR